MQDYTRSDGWEMFQLFLMGFCVPRNLRGILKEDESQFRLTLEHASLLDENVCQTLIETFQSEVEETLSPRYKIAYLEVSINTAARSVRFVGIFTLGVEDVTNN